jgi:O-antigen/teichoic acid export membrane protein
MLLASGFGLLKGFVFAHVLGDKGFGYYALMLLAAAYGQYLCTLGVADGVGRELPIRYGSGDIKGANRIRNRAVSTTLAIASSIGAIYIVVISLIKIETPTRLALAMALPFVACNVLFNNSLLDLRGRQQNVTYALLFMARNGAALVLGVLAALSFGLFGVLAVECLVSLLGFACFVFWLSSSFRFDFSGLHETTQVAKIGLPFMLNSLVKNTSRSIDRWFVGIGFGIAVLGKYAFVLLIANIGIVIATIMDQFFLPRLLYDYGAGKSDLRGFFRVVQEIMLVIALAGAVGFVPFMIAYRYFTSHYFVQFHETATLASIVYVGTVFQTMNLFEWVSVGSGRGAPLLGVNAVVAAVIAGAAATAFCLHAELVQFAWIFTWGAFLCLVTQYLLARRVCRRA